MSNAPLSFKVGSTIAAYRIVKASAANTVAVADTVTAMPIGVTTDTVRNTGEAIPVAITGLAKVQFNDSCAAGALVKADASGLGVAHVGLTAGSYVLGTLVGPTVNETGTIAEVLLQPHYKYL